jgi:hypothetical protein
MPFPLFPCSGPVVVPITTPTDLQPTLGPFTAPGTYVFILTVTGPEGEEETDEVVVVVLQSTYTNHIHALVCLIKRQAFRRWKGSNGYQVEGSKDNVELQKCIFAHAFSHGDETVQEEVSILGSTIISTLSMSRDKR